MQGQTLHATWDLPVVRCYIPPKFGVDNAIFNGIWCQSSKIPLCVPGLVHWQGQALLETMDQSRALSTLTFLPGSAAAFRDTFFQTAIHKTVPAGSFICLENNQCGYLPLVLSGEARVYKMSDEGRELTLYPILPGDSCILTASCIMNNIVFPANAVAVSDVEALLVPSQDVRSWLATYPDWSAYIFGLLSRRLVDVISLVEEVAFQRMDVRLARYLADASSDNHVIKKTREAFQV